MLNVKKDYLKQSAREAFNGVITLKNEETIELNNENVVEGSTAFTQSCCNGKFGFGGFISHQLDTEILISTNDPYLLDGAKIYLERQFFTESGSLVETIPLGEFYIDQSSVKRTKRSVKFTAYDESIKMNRALGNTVIIGAKTGNSLYTYLTYPILTGLKRYAPNQSFDEISANFPNCSGDVSKLFLWEHSYKEGITLREMFCAALQLMGAYAVINREKGGVDIRKFDTSEPLFTIDENNSIKRSVGDFSTKITGVSFGGETAGTDEFIYDLSDNLITVPAMAGQVAQNLLDAKNVADLEFYPAEITWFGDLAVEAGDCFLYKQPGLYGGARKLIVMDYVWRPHAPSTIRCFGLDDSGGASCSGGNSQGSIVATGNMLNGLTFRKLPEPDYNSLEKKDENTFYIVENSDNETINVYLGVKPLECDCQPAESDFLQGYLTCTNPKDVFDPPVNYLPGELTVVPDESSVYIPQSKMIKPEAGNDFIFTAWIDSVEVKGEDREMVGAFARVDMYGRYVCTILDYMNKIPDPRYKIFSADGVKFYTGAMLVLHDKSGQPLRPTDIISYTYTLTYLKKIYEHEFTSADFIQDGDNKITLKNAIPFTHERTSNFYGEIEFADAREFTVRYDFYSDTGSKNYETSGSQTLPYGTAFNARFNLQDTSLKLSFELADGSAIQPSFVNSLKVHIYDPPAEYSSG